ncbi:MAG TPA: hypothetical protein VMK84_30625 [Streptosporangiaceae bacterium]|nr:hypothetical protein [Streptosporangiaceae bacterium]
MAAGLFYVYTDPGSVDEAEFHDWYDHEHGPARLTVPGFGSACRYRALDGEKPSWLALYELDRPDAVDSPEYQALSANASDRDKAVGAGLATLDRRVYEQISEDGAPAGRPAPVILAVALSVPEGSEDDLAAWYTEEHIPMLLTVPGWRRIRRFRLIRALDQPRPGGPEPGRFLSVHELAGPEVLEDPGYQAAVSTPWRDRVPGMGTASALRRERRVFGLRNAIGG